VFVDNQEVIADLSKACPQLVTDDVLAVIGSIVIGQRE
jgi:hypothetical protein